MSLFLESRSSVLGLVVLLAMVSAGCEKPKVEPQNYIFYPAPPAPPRFQFLLSFNDVKGWVQGSRGSFADFIVGKDTNRTVGAGAILSPYGIGAHNGKVYVCDLGRQCVHVVDMANDSYSRLGDPRQVTQPINIFIDKDGTKYVCDIGGSRIAVFDAQDRFVRHLGNPATCTPLDMTVVGDELFVIDNVGVEIEVWDRAGKYLRTIVTQGDGPDKLGLPNSIVADRKGRLFVSDMRKSIVDVFDTQGRYLGSVGAPGDRAGFFARPKGMAMDPQDHLCVVDAQWDSIQIFDTFEARKRLPFAFGEAKGTPDGLGNPAGIAVDTTSLKAFSKYMAPDFVPEYVMFVTNQFGNNKVCVFAFGKSRTADYTPVTTRPATQPAGIAPAPTPAAPAATAPAK